MYATTAHPDGNAATPTATISLSFSATAGIRRRVVPSKLNADDSRAKSRLMRNEVSISIQARPISPKPPAIAAILGAAVNGTAPHLPIFGSVAHARQPDQSTVQLAAHVTLLPPP